MKPHGNQGHREGSGCPFFCCPLTQAPNSNYFISLLYFIISLFHFIFHFSTNMYRESHSPNKRCSVCHGVRGQCRPAGTWTGVSCLTATACLSVTPVSPPPPQATTTLLLSLRTYFRFSDKGSHAESHFLGRACSPGLTSPRLSVVHHSTFPLPSPPLPSLPLPFLFRFPPPPPPPPLER